IADGPWPPTQVELSPFSFRGRRLATIEVRPFTWDAGTGRLTAPLQLTVRVDFHRPPGASLLSSITAAPDPHVDPMLESSVLNWRQGSGWRVAPSPASRGSLLKGILDGKSAVTGAPLAFDESDPEVRVKIDTTGLYRLSFDDLAAKGYPANVPV